jgi:hypothetical protein
MNLTLRKYELMKELGIETGIFYTLEDGWHFGTQKYLTQDAAAILERACREWLEKQSVFVYCYNRLRDGLDRFTFKFLDYSYDLKYPCLSTNETFYKSFDAAQIAALEYCLKERTTQCTED